MTGAAGAGIGQAVARRFAAEGAEVVLTDAHARRAGEVAEKLTEATGRAILGLELDVRDQGQVDRAVQTAIDRHGQIDILFNNAGINELKPVWEIDDATWGPGPRSLPRGHVPLHARRAAGDARARLGSDREHGLGRRLHWIADG